MKALKRLLNALDRIMESHEELGDTDVRERMYEAVFHGFIVQTNGYVLPEEFGMFEPGGNHKVKKALQEFIESARKETVGKLATPHERLSAFQDPEVTGRDDLTYDEFFGHAEALENLAKMFEKPNRT